MWRSVGFSTHCVEYVVKLILLRFSTHCVENVSETIIEGNKVVQVGRLEAFSVSLCQRLGEFLYHLFPIFSPFVFQNFVLNTKPEKPVALDKSLINLFIRIVFGTINNCTSILMVKTEQTVTAKTAMLLQF